ncbi:Uncharacterised protein g8382 [Pycnogonum litorale]
MQRNLLKLKILSLYKRCLRSAKGKPGFEDYVKGEFRKNSSIPRSETIRIEFLIRRAERQLATTLRDENVTGMKSFTNK